VLSVTRRVKFSAAHRLYDPELSDAENERVFGACANPNGHGHNYVLEVTVAGVPDPKTGMILDLKDLKAILHREIVSKVDHKHLNLDVEFLAGVNPTAEMLAVRFFDVLCDKLPAGELVEVKVYESEDNIACRRV
jgi:6-pyruvoyltetrahydropterin/6-carboxytetrahydropterin synthase